MARPRRKGRRLTKAELDELCSLMHLLLEGRSAFSSDDDRRRVWRENRDEVRRHYRQNYRQSGCYDRGPEPPAWHVYDAPPEDRDTFPEVPYANE